MKNTGYAEPAAAVASIQRDLDEQIDAIRGLRSFSDAGRKTEMAKLVLAARERVNQMRTDFVSEREAKRASLYKYLFGDFYELEGSEIIANRDAQDRAAQLATAEDAMAMLQRAEQHSDGSLASAVAEKAYTKGWSDVCEQYADWAGKSRALELLLESHPGRHANLTNGVIFRIRNPDELSTADEITLRELAGVHAPGMGPDEWLPTRWA